MIDVQRDAHQAELRHQTRRDVALLLTLMVLASTCTFAFCWWAESRPRVIEIHIVQDRAR